MGTRFATGWPAVAALAATQHGRVTTRQLLERGISKRAVDRAVMAGRLHREHVGVYAVGHLAPSARGRWMSAVLACGTGAVLSHRSAAVLRRLRPGEGPRVDVTVPTKGGRRRPRIAIHRAPLPVDEVTEWEGIPVVTVARLIADLAHDLCDDQLTRLVREAQYMRLFDIEATRRAAARRPSRALNAILDDFDVVSTTWLEDEFLRIIDRHGLPRPTGQRRVSGFRIDFTWEGARLVVETDGAAAHQTLDAFQRDRTQGNRLQLDGWLVLRFTAADLRRRPSQVAALVQEALGE
jgi:very-short-patch-repair endonuclease